MSEEMISVAEAAERLGVHRTRINQLIEGGQLPALRIGRAYAIRIADLDLVRDRQPAGRPKKEGAAAVTNGTTGTKATAKPVAKKASARLVRKVGKK